jgi:4-hydroxy-3-methylbut-2-enyl diphosphate reductase
VPAHLIEDASHLQPAWLDGVHRLGITAGASAPERLVRELIDALTHIAAVAVREHRAVHEDVHFTLPKEVS